VVSTGRSNDKGSYIEKEPVFQERDFSLVRCKEVRIPWRENVYTLSYLENLDL